MIHAVIFTKNRAMQLRLLLDSMDKYAKGIFDVTVLYNPQGDEYLKAYDKLISETKGIEWVRRHNLKEELLTELKKPYEYTAFFCDDDTFYQSITDDLLTAFTQDILTFSLHLGKNHEYCYTFNRPVSLGDHEVIGDYIKWDYRTKEQNLDFAYPLSITSHIYRTEDLLKITEPLQFNSPNEYENRMQGVDIGKYMIASYPTSRVVNNPINMVQLDYPNRFGIENTQTPEELNQRYLNGEIIDINCLPDKVIGTHQEFPFTFKKLAQ